MQIVNTVATVTLSSPLNLERLHSGLEGSKLGTSVAHWLKYRLQPENQYVAFYKSGKFLLTGKDVLKSLEFLTQRVITLINSTGVHTNVERVDINNIVGKEKIELKTSLEIIIAKLDPYKAEYEPEQFPALIYKDWGLSFLLFSSGSLIVTGAKDINQISIGLEQFTRLIN